MKKIRHNRKKISPAAYRLIASLNSKKKRNILRGCVGKQSITSRDIEEIRKNNSPFDSRIIGEILKGENNIIDNNKTKKKTSGDLFTMTSFSAVSWKNEVWYTAGYINSMLRDSLRLLDIIKGISAIDSMESEHALGLMASLSKEYGASNFLSFKLAYLRSCRELSPKELGLVAEIETEICHKENVGLHFSALENISPKISIFVVSRRRVSGLLGKVDGNLRKAISLSNFIPTPIDEQDAASFLLRAVESCLLDTICAVITIFNLDKSFSNIKCEFEKSLDPIFLTKLTSTIGNIAQIRSGEIVTDHYREESEDNLPSLNLYRLSSAFLERPELCQYRNKFDRVIGVRLMEEITKEKKGKVDEKYAEKHLLIADKETLMERGLSVYLDEFYRTFIFLNFILSKEKILYLSNKEIKYVLENTVNLDMLLSENELETLYMVSPTETKSLVSVLALALYRKKSIDPDVDYKFRENLTNHVKEEHEGSVIDFINSLLEDSPQIANYIVESLDEVTLEKMYRLVNNASQASQIRCEILKAIGQRLNRIEYLIEADSITTRSKLSNLMQYFDSSRMYVDSVAMKKWLDSNPTASTEQYRSLYARIEARISSIDDTDKDEDGLFIIVNDQDEYLVAQIAKDAFEQFCLNAEFGIQSYLGRRIRHNTLDGVTINTVDAVLSKPEYQAFISNQNVRRTVDSWMASYKAIINKLRAEYLQFKSSSSLFKANLDQSDPATKENIKKLSNTLRLSGGSELFNDLVISFCWRQISVQLDNAARFIKTNLLREANASIDKHFTGSHGVIENQIKSELHEAVNEVFKKIADWFQVPQTGFAIASVRDLCQIILIELNKQNGIEFSGDAVDIKYTGISVHRLYDCLAVLLQNAHKHGVEENNVLGLVCAKREASDSTVDRLSVEITSKVSSEAYEGSKQRILEAIDSAETGIDMVTEGYTGIKKLKFITKLSEGRHTIKCVHSDIEKKLRISFSLHAEREAEIG